MSARPFDTDVVTSKQLAEQAAVWLNDQLCNPATAAALPITRTVDLSTPTAEAATIYEIPAGEFTVTIESRPYLAVSGSSSGRTSSSTLTAYGITVLDSSGDVIGRDTSGYTLHSLFSAVARAHEHRTTTLREAAAQLLTPTAQDLGLD